MPIHAVFQKSFSDRLVDQAFHGFLFSNSWISVRGIDRVRYPAQGGRGPSWHFVHGMKCDGDIPWS